jgi:predicted phosphodiesterase
MRLLVLSDVHANARALDCVLSHAESKGWDQLLFLGDAVGYGDEPHEVVSRLRELPRRAGIRGNHEVMLDTLRNGRRPNASQAIVDILEQHRQKLGSEDLAYLDGLVPEYLEDTWGAVHGALRKPFEYMLSVPLARSNASHMKRDVYFVGHTHVPAAYLQDQGGVWRLRPFTGAQGMVSVPSGGKAFLNPGAVNLPRDGKEGSSYGVFDEESREFEVYRIGP